MVSVLQSLIIPIVPIAIAGSPAVCVAGVEVVQGWRQSSNTFCGGAGTAGVEGTV